MQAERRSAQRSASILCIALNAAADRNAKHGSQKEGGKIIPIRNIDKGINNAFNDINGLKLYPARKSSDPSQGHPFALGYANLRESAEVNNSRGFRDLWQDNLIGKVEGGGQEIGTIVAESYDELTPKMRWFKVKLTSTLKKKFDKDYAWVRSDNVTFREFTKKSSKKKSSFDGNMIERYNTSYQLGAEVFPHSGWNLYSNVVDDDIFQNFDANQLDINI